MTQRITDKMATKESSSSRAKMEQEVYKSRIQESVDSLVSYYKWERSTKFEGEIIIPSTKFALECLVEVYRQFDSGHHKDLVLEAQNRLSNLTNNDLKDKHIMPNNEVVYTIGMRVVGEDD